MRPKAGQKKDQAAESAGHTAEASTPASDGAAAVSADTASLMQRPVRSFVLRQGRVSNAQQRYRDSMMAKIGVDYAPAQLDFDALFGRRAPRILEIGFGMGETTATIAVARADHDFLGVEVHTPGVGSLCKLIAERGLGNVRIIQHDAAEVLRDMIAPDSLAGVHVFFPDPWPKLRHRKRRLIQPPLVALLTDRLMPGGYIHCATDWENYAEQMLETLAGEPRLENTAAGFAPRPDYRPLTKFEQRGLRLGHGIWDVVFRKRSLPVAG
ncbi:tRNA (guanosine(46)-N7)-methyltransferase TrmB [Rhodocyclus tenuis]|nr:tRNA (guanosine(46)-N7)-methyltransferase TrmB [Rhodocyclus gracilis]